MMPIKKTIRPKSVRPIKFDEWKRLNAQNIKTWEADHNLTAGKIWAELGPDAKENLQETLLKQQGFVCCYCGSRIEKNSIEIEHLRPKSLFRKQIFEYNNLFGSCFGGSKDTDHFVKDGETLESISTSYNCAIESIKIYRYDSQAKKEIPQPIDKNVKLKKGEKLLISPVKQQKHCGAKKDNNEVSFDLEDANLANYFDYDSSDAFVKSSKKSIQDDIEVLNLNEKNLRDERIKSIVGIKQFYYNILSLVKDNEKIIQMLKEKRESYLTKDKDGKFIAFYFVWLNQIDKNLRLLKP